MDQYRRFCTSIMTIILMQTVQEVKSNIYFREISYIDGHKEVAENCALYISCYEEKEEGAVTRLLFSLLYPV